MGTCFFTSNCFIKSIKFAPLIKSKYPAYIKKNSSAIRCQTQYGLSSYSYNDKGAVINSDWKTFRARLVAAERISSRNAADHLSSAVDIKKAMNYFPQVILGQNWAHRIYEPEKGCLLIATEKLDGIHIFERTVILIISVGGAGLSGIVLNRPSLVSVEETKSTDLEGAFCDRPLCFGGPMKEEVFLVNTKGNDVNGVGKSGRLEQVMQDWFFGTDESVGFAAEMVKRNMVDVGDVRFFDGFCKWENDEMRRELKAGFWTLAV